MKNYREMIRKANGGDSIAQLNLAYAYFNGEVNGFQEIGEGLKYLEMAAKKGNPEIQRMYANFLADAGLDNEAFEWFEKAASQGDVESQVKLASSYFVGSGVEKNDKEAFLWAQKAFDNGDRDQACCLLGILYLQGKAVSTDALAAYRLFKIGAENGNEQANDFKKQMEAEYPQLKKM